MNQSPKKIGLALGSGAARGWAHIGAINALEELGVRIDCVAGTSMGALVGSAYADGKLKALEEIVYKLNKRMLLGFFDPGFSHSGLIDGYRLAEFIRDNIEIGDIHNFSKSFRAVSTDILTGEEIAIEKGDVIEAIRSSIAMPGIFTPVKSGNRLLVDGALVNPLPVSVARDMGADFVIAVDVNYGTQELPGAKDMKKASSEQRKETRPEEDDYTPDTSWEKMLEKLGGDVARFEYMVRSGIDEIRTIREMPNIFEVLLASYNILEVQITEMRLKYEPPDVLMRPDCSYLGFLDLDKAGFAIDEGYKSVMEHTHQLPLHSK
jgi:NTE family protein